MPRDGVLGQNLVIESGVDGALIMGMDVLRRSRISCKYPWCVRLHISYFKG